VTVLAASQTSQSVLDQPGTVAFLVVFGMGVLLFFVFRSMARHLRKVATAARAEEEAAARAEQAGPGDGSGWSDSGSGGGSGPSERADDGGSGDWPADTGSGWAAGTADGTGYAKRRP